MRPRAQMIGIPSAAECSNFSCCGDVEKKIIWGVEFMDHNVSVFGV
jgi:hypothetical protein